MKRTLKFAAFLGLDFMALGFHWIDAQSPSSLTMPTFYARRDYAEPGVTQIHVGDTNQDAIPDIVINNHGTIVVMLGNGDGTFRTGPSTNTVLTGGSEGFALADLNGDGIPDAVLSGGLYNGTAGIGVSLGIGDGTYQAGTFYQTGSERSLVGPVIGDFNGDGILDAIVVGGSGSVWLFTGKGGGVFNQGSVAATVATSPMNLADADF